MANALALASVTAVLKDLLNDGLAQGNIDAIGQFAVTALPLDQVAGDEDDPVNRLNIYMWHATRNPGWVNMRLPARNAGGARQDSPYLALDMHFILTATGAEELNAEILLGYGMQVLHETPVLTRDAVRDSLGAAGGPADAALLPPAHQFIIDSDLADQFEKIRITPAVPDTENPMQLEGISNLWSAFSAPLRPSALYHVSCVLIESNAPVRSALPVLTLGGRTAHIRRPFITRVTRLPDGAGGARDPLASIEPGDWVAIEGTSLASDIMRVRLGDRILTAVAANAANARVDVQLPTDIEAGLTAIQIEHLFTPEGGGADRLWEMSNTQPVVIAPQLASHAVTGTATGGRFTGVITAALAHPVGADQVAAMLFNPLPGSANEAFSVRCRPRTVAGTELVADVRDVAADDYLIRVEVGGAASALTMGGSGFDGPVADLDP